MSNPFRDGSMDMDLSSIAMPEAERVERTKAALAAASGSDHAVLFDAERRTVSPSGQSMIKHIMGLVRKRERKHNLAILDGLGKIMGEQEKRIVALEAALDIKRNEAADDLESDALMFTTRRRENDE